MRLRVCLNSKGILPPFKDKLWLFIVQLASLAGYSCSNYSILSSYSFNSFVFSLLIFPFLRLLSYYPFYSFIVDIFSYIPPHPFNHTNYVYLIIIMSSLHHITSSLLHIFYIVLLIYLSPINCALLCHNYSIIFHVLSVNLLS